MSGVLPRVAKIHPAGKPPTSRGKILHQDSGRSSAAEASPSQRGQQYTEHQGSLHRLRLPLPSDSTPERRSCPGSLLAAPSSRAAAEKPKALFYGG